MAAGQKPSQSPAWEAFAQRHAGNPWLTLDPLYAVDDKLLDLVAGAERGTVLQRQGLAPGMLTAQEIAFERNLIRTAGAGFFSGQPFDCLLLHAPGDPRIDGLEQQIRGLLVDTLGEEDVHRNRAQALLDSQARWRQFAAHRATAYAGWLVTNPTFRKEREVLRSHHGKYVEVTGRFPMLVDDLLQPAERNKGFAAASVAYPSFYRRWGLRTFITWDLPVPMAMALGGTTAFGEFGSSEAGLNLFLPWYLLRDGRLPLVDLARNLQAERNPAHLAGWLTVTGRGADLGDTRLRAMLVLFRFQHLALQSRYAGRAAWTKGRQDAVFAQYLQLSVESVRQLRLRLQQDLTAANPTDR